MKKLSMADLHRKSIEEFKIAEKFPIIAVLENIRSAYNVGSVFRTADAFLLESIIITGYTARPPHKEIKKTALGAEESVDWTSFEKAGDAILFLRDKGYKIFAVEQVDESIFLEDLSAVFSDKVAFIFGNEVNGVEASTISLCDGCIEIPQFGMKHSLNISVAAGIVLWEAVKCSSSLVRKNIS
jgi:tRNA G18 (ribose-2'-O)-methylase SpoU